jgi:putative spermidine/putrescine transport system ATP-binding protein
MAYIEFEGIEKYFGQNHVLKTINLSIEKGKLATLLGPSGCGKSTLLRCLAGLETVDSGHIRLDGEDITEKEPKDRGIGMVFQQYSLFPNLNVYDNIAFGLKLKKTDRGIIEEKVRNVMGIVDLKGKEKSYPSKLSGGQQQRVALARSLVMEPKVLLLDEPLSAIDAKLRKSLQTEIRNIQKELGITTLFVTHDQDEAMLMSDVIHLFNVGSIEQSGTPTQIYTKPKTRFAASFIGHFNILSVHDFQKFVGGEITPIHDALPNDVREKAQDLPREQEVLPTSNHAGTVSDIAFRPEVIEISEHPIVGRKNAYVFKAKVSDITNRSNVLRYTLESDRVHIHADVLFQSYKLFEKGMMLHVAIEKDQCLML